MTEEIKPDPQQSSEQINLKVVSTDGEIFFKVKKTTPFQKLVTAFCERQGKPAGSVKFMFEGERVSLDATPLSLEMEDGDSLQAVLEQVGGGDIKPDPVPSDETISIRLQAQDTAEMVFKVKKTTPFKKIMTAFCERQGKAMGSVRFTFEGALLVEHDTPVSKDMEDGDTIDVQLQQTGGQ